MSGLYEQVEKAARTCYQSYDKIGNGTAEQMVKALIKLNHTAMLEHGTVYLHAHGEKAILSHYGNNKYSVYKVRHDDVTGTIDEYVTTNYRVIIEDGLKHDLKYMCEPMTDHEKRYSIKFITNLQVATEMLRHRNMSFAMESSRYCCYDKEKFGDELTFIVPDWIMNEKLKPQFIEWVNGMQDCENHYMRLRAAGWSAEQCAQFLPKAAKTTIVMTGFEKDWQHFFSLRYFENTGKVHPQMKEAATLAYNLINK